jgi:hypothetical protein
MVCAIGLGAVFAVAFAARASWGATIVVPAQQPTIQAAIDAASNGDTITVAPGTYKENLDFNGKAVKLVSTNGAASTTIDGGSTNYVIDFHTNETPATVVSGFTLINGGGNFVNSVYAIGASPTLTDNIFQGGPGDGLSIEGWSSSLVLKRNLFTGWTCAGGEGIAVVSFVNTSSPIIKDNVFADNQCTALSIVLPVGNVPDVANNTFVNNSIGIEYDTRVSTGTELYRNNLIYGNDTGVLVDFGEAGNYPIWENNLVYGNTTNYSGVPDPTGTSGNISADPLLGGLSVSDYHPDAGSPVIDAGLNAAVDPGDTDFYDAQRISVGGSGQAIVDIGAVEYVGQQPTVTLTSSTSSILLGANITLTWSSTNASSCVAGGAWSGTLALSGTRTIMPPAGQLSYQVTCKNSSASRGQAVGVTITPPPTISIAASPASILQYQLSSIVWSTTNASVCSKSGAWSGSAPTSGNLTVGPNPGTYTYTLTCTGPDGTATASATLTVIPLPQITLTFSPSSIPIGTTGKIVWTSLNTTSCVASSSWSGTEPTSGSQTIGPFADAGLYEFQLTCTGPGGTTSNEQGIQAYVPPTASISASPKAVVSGAPVSIIWSSTNANACQTSGAWGSFAITTSGNLSVTSAAPGSYSYAITCTGQYGGSATDSSVVMVYAQPTATFTAGQSTLTAGTSTTLTWTSSQASSCSASGNWSGALALSGSRTVTPMTPGTFVYDLSCQNPASAVQKVVTLTVTAPPTGGGGSLNLLDLAALSGVALMGLGRVRRRSENPYRGTASSR